MSPEPDSKVFQSLAILCLAAGICLMFVFIIYSWLEGINQLVILFGAAVLFAGIANALAFLVLHRMKSTGYEVGLWRWPLQDFRLYKEYWRVAPDKGWSRFVLAGAILSFGFAVAFLLFVAWT